MRKWRSALLPVLVVHWGLAVAIEAGDPAGKLDFNRDVRPILANHCWSCHGPDESAREAGLRLDERSSALATTESGFQPIVPGEPQASALIARINAAGDECMPPPSFNKPLTPKQRETLRRWIAEGAEYSRHWAFVAPARPSLPPVQHVSWPRNEIDRFVLHRLEAEGLAPTEETDRLTWLRRVTLDLTGLPPTLEERSQFLADQSATAYENVVERLFASPRYAERMAMQWLDVARYADTNGYNNDELRTMWPWRDWVIDAFRRDLPYDQFVTEQLAGDLLPEATLDQRVATGFCRNHVLTTEGGIIEEEYRVEYVADRVHTTASVFLALSLQCARCHDHKYDPFTQADYYRFAAFFNNIPDKVVPYSQGRMAEPLLKVPSPGQQRELASLKSRQEELNDQLKSRVSTIDTEINRWEAELNDEQIQQAGPLGLVAHFPLDKVDDQRCANLVAGQPAGIISGKAATAAGQIGGALEFDGSNYVEANEVGAFDNEQPFSLSAWVYPTSKQPSTVLSKMDEADAHRGYDLILEQGRVASHLVHHWPDRGFKVITKEAIALNQWHHLLVTYDGSRRSKGVRIFVDGKQQEWEATTDNLLDGTLRTERPFHIGRRHTTAPFHGRIDDVRLYAVALTAEDASKLAAGESLHDLRGILSTPSGHRTAAQSDRLRNFFLQQVDAPSKQLRNELSQVERQLADLDRAIPVTMVMSEMSPRRVTHILRRGQYDQPGDEVQPGVFGEFDGLPSAGDRLALARWLTDPRHPLTARVAVNRLWEMLFGVGIVETVEDFGVQGALPSHPELLDWLATELERSGWSQRAILRRIVLSATYRQSSAAPRELMERDPGNRLLARGPRFRLPAEQVRDNALAVSGLLVETVGGPSVKPYQPAGLWEDVSVERRDKYEPDSGAGLYRRSMYTFWKRTCPPPGMTAFDAPDRETCVVRRARTNTPLQALVLLNDPTYVEAARKFAERVMSLASSDADRLDRAWELAVTRSPAEDERRLLYEMLQAARQRYQQDESAAEKLLSVGRSPRDDRCDARELAAWTTVTSLILNLDEAISKP